MDESPKSQVLRILESKWDTLAFANAPIRGKTCDFFYKSNGIVWWCQVAKIWPRQFADFDYDTPEDWPHWQEILDELKTLESTWATSKYIHVGADAHPIPRTTTKHYNGLLIAIGQTAVFNRPLRCCPMR